MEKFNKNIFIGILILIASASSLFIKSIPIIWIGGFIWGASLIMNGLKNSKQQSYSFGGIEKEIVNCDNCKQKIRVPKDKQRYINITCPHCKQSPFLSLSDRFHRSPKNTKLLLVGSGILAVILFGYVISNQGNSVADATPIVENKVALSIPNDLPSVIIPTNIVSFSTGEFLNKNSYYLNGNGELEIRNGTNDDAVAKLVNINTNRSIATIYIGANNNYTLKNISDGNYKLVFNLGHDWDTISKKFTKNSSYSVFEESFDFLTTSSYYSTFSVTLNPVLGGTAETNNVNPEEFSNY